jgi:stress response protein YsnF
MVQSAPMVVIDEDGKRGTIQAYYPPEKKFVVSLDDQQMMIPADMITSDRNGSYTVPLRFSDLASAYRINEQDNEALVVPVIEEELRVGKRAIETGQVRISKVVREHEEVVD